jgi:hypothetical protein
MVKIPGTAAGARCGFRSLIADGFNVNITFDVYPLTRNRQVDRGVTWGWASRTVLAAGKDIAVHRVGGEFSS